MLSLIVPLYNEARGVYFLYMGLKTAMEKTGGYEIILVDNGSNDGTGEEIDAIIKNDSQVRKVVVPVNNGYGYGIRKGLETAKGEILGWIDGDLQYDPETIVVLFGMMKGGFDIGMAERIGREDGMKRTVLSKGYSLMVRMLFSIPVKDINCKPKLMTRNAYESMKLESNDWFIDTEVLSQAAKNRFKIATTPLVLRKRETGKSNVRNAVIIEFLKNIWKHKAGMR